MSWLSNQELTNRYLIGVRNWPQIPPEQRQAAVQKILKEHAGCCFVSKNFWWDTPVNFFLNGLFNRYFFEIDEYTEDTTPHRSMKYPYKKKETLINACGTNTAGQWAEPEISNDEYAQALIEIQKKTKPHQ